LIGVELEKNVGGPGGDRFRTLPEPYAYRAWGAKAVALSPGLAYGGCVLILILNC
jgi:hypothetical protein